MTSPTRMGRTLIIVNPAAQSGAAAEAGEQLRRFLELYLHDSSTFRLVQTERPHHATELAAQATGFDTVLAVGGDGLVHEVANGLMRIGAAARPVLGVVPIGSGNDYARTLGLPEMARERDFAALVSCVPARLDVGRIEYAVPVDAADRTGWTAHGAHTMRREYFVQTFSFGMDAAIALGTYTLRQSTGLAGTSLYLLSGLDAIGAHYRDYEVAASFDGAPAERLRTVTFAVQIGPTYGSGFRICPAADPTDGQLDVCYVTGPLPRARALPLFLAAKGGRHLKARSVHLRRARSVSLSFASGDYPIQADGERICAERATVGILPGVLRVLRPAE